MRAKGQTARHLDAVRHEPRADQGFQARRHLARLAEEPRRRMPSRRKRSRLSGRVRAGPKSLVAKCQRAERGRSYRGVYGRMEWDKPAPTMTTQCYGFGNGR